MTTTIKKLAGVKVVVEVTTDDNGKVIGFPITYTEASLARMTASNQAQATKISSIQAEMAKE